MKLSGNRLKQRQVYSVCSYTVHTETVEVLAQPALKSKRLNEDSDIRREENLSRAVKRSSDPLAGSGSTSPGPVLVGHTTGARPALAPTPGPSPLEGHCGAARSCAAQLGTGTGQVSPRLPLGAPSLCINTAPQRSTTPHCFTCTQRPPLSPSWYFPLFPYTHKKCFFFFFEDFPSTAAPICKPHLMVTSTWFLLARLQHG